MIRGRCDVERACRYASWSNLYEHIELLTILLLWRKYARWHHGSSSMDLNLPYGMKAKLKSIPMRSMVIGNDGLVLPSVVPHRARESTDISLPVGVESRAFLQKIAAGFIRVKHDDRGASSI